MCIHTKLGWVLSLSLIVVCCYVDRGNTGDGSDELKEEGAVLQINQWRIVFCNGIDPIRVSMKDMIIQEIIINRNCDLRGIRNLSSVVYGRGGLYIKMSAFFDVTRLTVGTMTTLVIRQGVVRLLIKQEMRACFSTETDIGSRTNTEHS